MDEMPQVLPHHVAPEILRQRLLIEGYYGIAIDEPVIETYFSEIAGELGLRAYSDPILFSPRGAGKAENEGYDAFVPLIDSGISLYVWTGPKFLSTVLCTCKRFDEAKAVAATKSFFEMTDEIYTLAF